MFQWILLLLVSIFSSSCYGTYKARFINAGEDFRLQCKTDGTSERLRPLWRLPASALNTTRLRKSHPQKTYQNNRTIWTNTITVSSSTIDDTGLYQCEFHDQANDEKLLLPTDDLSWLNSNLSVPEQRKHKSVFVYVYDGETLLVPMPKGVRVARGEKLVIPCRTTRIEAEVKLSRVHSTNPISVSRLTYEPAIGYIIYNVTSTDAGLWKCIANFEGVETQRTTFVTVNADASKNFGKTRIVSKEDGQLSINNTLVLRCEVTCDVGGVVRFEWDYPRKQKGLVVQPTNGREGGIRIKVNDSIPGYAVPKIDKRVVLWSEIRIPKVQYSDSGTYSCSLHSGDYVQIERIDIEVIGENYLRIISTPLARKLDKSNLIEKDVVEGVRGYPTRLDFEVDAFPEPDFRWLKDNSTINEIQARISEKNSGRLKFSSLIFYNTSSEHSGNYELTIENAANKRVIQFRFVVQDPSKPVVETGMEKILVDLGQDVDIICNMSGRPLPNLKWYHDNHGPIAENLTFLRIVRVKADDAGNYTCVANNDLGQAVGSMTLRVRDTNQDFTIGFSVGSAILLALLVYTAVLFVVKIRKVKKKMMEHEKMYLVPVLDTKEMPVEEQAERLSYNPKKWEVPRDRLKLGKTLGRGAFGKVVQATAFDINKSSSCKTVAVKMLKVGSRSNEYAALMSELKILIHLGPHLNIVNLLGACTTKDGPLMIVVEYCRHGNLSNYLRSMRDRYIGQKKLAESKCDDTDAEMSDRKRSSGDEGDITDVASVSDESAFVDCTVGNKNHSKRYRYGKRDSTTSCISASDTIASREDESLIRSKARLSSSGSEGGRSIKKHDDDEDKNQDEKDSLCVADLLSYSLQVARGMEFLSSKLCIHRDLAARNVLLSDYQVVKICDFGLARDVYKHPDYVRSGEARLPLKWMSPESIFDRVYSNKSDVWSFGVLLWEIFSLGASPYPGIQMDEDFCNKLNRGVRMKKPQYATDAIYSAMLACWEHKPEDRPTFTRLAEEVSDILQSEAEHEYLDVMKIFEMNFEGKVLRGVKPVQEPDETFEEVKMSESEDKRHALIAAVEYTDIDTKACIPRRKNEAASNDWSSSNERNTNSIVSDLETGNYVENDKADKSSIPIFVDRNLVCVESRSCQSLDASSTATSICESPPSYTTVIEEND